MEPIAPSFTAAPIKVAVTDFALEKEVGR